jgi:hypothetical protein
VAATIRSHGLLSSRRNYLKHFVRSDAIPGVGSGDPTGHPKQFTRPSSLRRSKRIFPADEYWPGETMDVVELLFFCTTAGSLPRLSPSHIAKEHAILFVISAYQVLRSSSMFQSCITGLITLRRRLIPCVRCQCFCRLLRPDEYIQTRLMTVA